ncbi:unnamed protein product [Brassica oleracea var. botrytis]
MGFVYYCVGFTGPWVVTIIGLWAPHFIGLVWYVANSVWFSVFGFMCSPFSSRPPPPSASFPPSSNDDLESISAARGANSDSDPKVSEDAVMYDDKEDFSPEPDQDSSIRTFTAAKLDPSSGANGSSRNTKIKTEISTVKLEAGVSSVVPKDESAKISTDDTQTGLGLITFISQPGTNLLGVAVEPKFNHVLTYLMIPSIFRLGVKTQEADFICYARVVEVLRQNGRSFVFCTGCSRKLDKSGTFFRCNRCDNPNVTGVIKYRVELSVDDGSDNATFVVFDRKMLKLTKQDAAVLALDEMNGGGGDELPHCLKELDGKDFVFQIRVTPYNFTSNHRTFTVSGISDHINPRYYYIVSADFHHQTFNTNEAPLLKGKVVKHPLLSATRLEVKAMSQIHPGMKAKRVVAANAPVSEVTELLNGQHNSAFVSL